MEDACVPSSDHAFRKSMKSFMFDEGTLFIPDFHLRTQRRNKTQRINDNYVCIGKTYMACFATEEQFK